MAGTTTAAATDGSIFSARRWHELYHSAIIELDSAKLPGRIAEARRAILDRAKEILARHGMNTTSSTTRFVPCS